MKKVIVLTSVFLVLLLATGYKTVVTLPPKEKPTPCVLLAGKALQELASSSQSEGIVLEIYPIKKTKSGSNGVELAILYRDLKGKLIKDVPYSREAFTKYTSNYIAHLKKAKKMKKEAIPFGYELRLDIESIECARLCFSIDDQIVRYSYQCDPNLTYKIMKDSATGKCPPCTSILYKQETVGSILQTTFQ